MRFDLSLRYRTTLKFIFEVYILHGSGALFAMTEILKLLSKPQPFSGEEKDWKNWCFAFMAYVGAVDKTMANSRESDEACRRDSHEGNDGR